MPTNREAVEANDHRQALVTLLETLATQLDTTEAQIHAQLAAQYRGAWAELVEIDRSLAPAKESELERIRRQREARSGASADSA